VASLETPGAPDARPTAATTHRVPRRLLVVSFFWPPSAEAGVHRPMAMSKYLRRMGHRVTILTTSAYGSLPDDATEGVERSFDLQLPYARLQGRRVAEDTFGGGGYSGRRHPLSYVLVPEATVMAWAPFAVARALALHRRTPFDAVITTSPPESAHLVGRALQCAGAAWVADVRDGWTFESFRAEWPTRVQHRLDLALEGALFRAANRVAAVARPLVEDLRVRIGARAELLPNGWDPELLDWAGTETPMVLDPERASLLYTGRLAIADRDLRPLLDALLELARSEPETAARIELVLAGAFTDAERRLFGRDVSPARMVVLESLPRQQSLALQRAADALLLVTAGSRRHEVTGKVFEYLGAGRPVLALAGDDEAARIVLETGAGVVVRRRDTEAVKGALRAVARGELSPPPPEALRGYSYPELAEKMERLVEEAIREKARTKETA
jgi:glycosyltransferase involved in cell wall biosynthesis